MKSKSEDFILYTLGDPAGIGPEILIKVLKDKKFLNSINHLVVGDADIIQGYNREEKLKFHIHTDWKNFKLVPGVVNILDVPSGTKVYPGRPNKITGNLSYRYLKLGVKIVQEQMKKLRALITLPVSKFYIRLAGYKFEGHTEFLQKEFKVPQVEMLFLTPDFDLLLLTRHIPLKKVPLKINQENLIYRILFVADIYKRYFKVKPRIALLGLNPHAGEGGMMGKEEEEIFKPVVRKLKNRIFIQGPFPADGFFRNFRRLQYDIVVSCYHDQVLPLVKAVYPQAVNFTVGLPFLRFSPNHGPAFDIAGKGRAEASSLRECLKYALKLYGG